jgi:hypothetical protein
LRHRDVEKAENFVGGDEWLLSEDGNVKSWECWGFRGNWPLFILMVCNPKHCDQRGHFRRVRALEDRREKRSAEWLEW